MARYGAGAAQHGDMPIHVAVRHGAVPTQVIKQLVDGTPGVVVAKDNEGKTPLQLCIEHVWFAPRIAAALLDANPACATQKDEVSVYDAVVVPVECPSPPPRYQRL